MTCHVISEIFFAALQFQLHSLVLEDHPECSVSEIAVAVVLVGVVELVGRERLEEVLVGHPAAAAAFPASVCCRVQVENQNPSSMLLERN